MPKKNKGSGKKYSVLDQDCTRSDGKKGSYVLKIKPKPGKYKGRKRDSQGRVKVGCHTSKTGANAQRSAIEAGHTPSGSEIINEKSLRNYIRNFLKENAEISLTPPPKDTINELAEVIEQYYNRKMPEELQYDLDENVSYLFDSIIIDSGEDSYISKIKLIETSVNEPTSQYKKLFNRMRPSEYAESIGINWKGDDDKMGTTDTASYPSGHTCQAYYLAYVLSDKYPHLRNDFINLAEAVAQSRVDRGVHYPSDLDGGRELAWHLYKVGK